LNANGLLQHLLLTLRLNFRAGQALVYGYLIPIFFLLAFGSVFRSTVPPLLGEMGQLLAITVLGGACFGMPTAMVAERERGVWRRYRLLPTATSGLILSAMVARYLLVLTAAVMQILLAWCIYRTPLPARPGQLAVAFTFVCFAFLGMGLIIAMLADTVPAVQALGQAIFLPMIMIGGVGVPLRALPPWARHAAAFFPGRYAVEALQTCIQENGGGLAAARFALASLAVIGATACLAGDMIFRWDANQRLGKREKLWALAALLAWAGVGLAAERTGRLTLPLDAEIMPASRTAPSPVERWKEITDAGLDSITYEDVPGDDGIVTPLASSLDNLDAQGSDRLAAIEEKLARWEPGNAPDLVQRVRNYLCVCAIPDSLEDPLEAEIPYVVFEKLKREVPPGQLKKALGWIILHPWEGSVLLDISSLGVEGEVSPERVRERSALYAKKLLRRLLGKGPSLTPGTVRKE